MLIHHDTDEWQTKSQYHVCAFHKDHPGEAYPGCTCSMACWLEQRSPEEVATIKAERERQREDAILAEADAIRSRRKNQ